MKSLDGRASIDRWAKQSAPSWLSRLLVVPLAVLSMLFIFPAVAAAAGGTGGGGGGAGGGGGTTWSATYCVMTHRPTGVLLTYGINGGHIIYTTPYSGCMGDTPPPPGTSGVYPANGYETGAYGLCVSNFLEYRFYGTTTEPTATWSLGNISVPQVCQTAASGQINPGHWTWDAFSPTPIDRFDSGGGGFGPGANPQNDSFMASQYVNGGGQVVARARTANGKLVDSLAFLQTSQIGTRTCAGLAASTPNHAPAGTAKASKLAQGLAQTWAGTFGSTIAAQMADATPSGTTFQGNNFGAVPECASGFPLITTHLGIYTAGQSAFGACVVPEQEAADVYAGVPGEPGGYGINILTAGHQRIDPALGTGYPFAGAAGTPRARGGITWPNAMGNGHFSFNQSFGKQGKATQWWSPTSAWYDPLVTPGNRTYDPYDPYFRQAIVNITWAAFSHGWTISQPFTLSGVDRAYMGGLMNQPQFVTQSPVPGVFLPSNAYQASRWADCFLSPALTHKLPGGSCAATACKNGGTTPITRPPPTTACASGCGTPTARATVTVALTLPQSLEVGGQLYPAKYHAHYVGYHLSCSEPTCSVTLTKLSYTITVSGTNGYTRCAAKTQTNCEYALGNRRTTGSPVENSQTLTVGFYFATQPNQAVHATINGHATLKVHWVKTIVTVTATNKTKTSRTVPETRTVYSGVHTIVNGTNTQPVESGNQVP